MSLYLVRVEGDGVKVRCPTCKTVLRVPVPDKPVEGKPVGADYTDLLGFLKEYTCEHPENVKINGRCLACKPQSRPSSR